MKIRRVQSILLSYPFAEPIRLPFYGGLRTILKRDAMLIRVELENGLVGWGPGPGSTAADHAIRTVVAPFLEGRVLADPDALRVQFNNGPGDELALQKIYSAVEVALYDVLGKAHGVPVSELLGGRVRDRILLYGSAGMYMPPERYAEEAAGVQSLGFKAYKMRPALGPDGDIETVRRMREATGEGFELMIDAHGWWRMGDKSYDIETVERVAEAMAGYDICWLEEPLPPDDHEAYHRLKAKDIVPLASGEHEQSEERFIDLIQGSNVDYVQMDVCAQGGYAMGRRIFQEVAREGLRFAFHSWGTALEVIAAAQIGICWPENVVEYLEYPCYSDGGKPGMYEFPLASEMLRDPLVLEGGNLVVSREPGLGVQIDEGVIEKYPWIPGPWSYFKIDSPPQELAVNSDHSIQWVTR